MLGDTSNEYYLGFFKLNRGTASVILTTTISQSVNYSIQAPGIEYFNSGVITPNVRSIITFPDDVQVSSYTEESKGIYLTLSSDKVTVLGQNIRPRSGDTFLILPLTKQYAKEYVYYGISSARSIFQSIILIVGTKDDTILNLTVTQSVTISVSATNYTLIPGIEYPFVISRLQTLYIESVDDITGTRIVTNHPVSVFSGHESAYVPANFAGRDYLIEQIPPTVLWGKVSYVASLATRSRSTVKVLAAYNFTNIDIYCSNSTRTSYTINQGSFFERIIGQENCAICASNKVLVAQFGHGRSDDGVNGDPFMMLVPATSQYLSELVFSTIYDSTMSHYLNIIVLLQYFQPEMIYLIANGVNESLSTQQWTPILVNNVNKAYITQVNIFQEGIVKISHANSKALMTAMVYGFAFNKGYGHPGGFHDIAGVHFITIINLTYHLIQMYVLQN